MWWPVGVSMRNMLFVRPSQQNTLDEIIESYNEARADPNPDPSAGPTGLIVMGPPGIGKGII